MSYSTQQDAIELYGSDYVLTSVTREGVTETGAYAKAAAKAASEMDSYLGAQYTVPLATTPPIVMQFEIDIAIYRASSSAGQVTDEKRKRFEDALAWLLRVSRGDVVLDVDGDGEADNEGGGSPEISGPTRIFSRSTMGGL